MNRTEKVILVFAGLLLLISSSPVTAMVYWTPLGGCALASQPTTTPTFASVQVPMSPATGVALEPQSNATATVLSDTNQFAVLKMSDGGPAYIQQTIGRSSEYGCEKAEMVCDISPLDLNNCLDTSISISGISPEEGWEPAIVMSNCVCYRQCDELTLHVWTMNGLDTLFRCCDTSGAVISEKVPVGSLIHFKPVKGTEWLGAHHYVTVLDRASCICEDCVERSYFNRIQ